MKYIVSGSRRIRSYQMVETYIELAIEHFGERPTLIIEGGQRTFDEKNWPIGGVDYLASLWAGLNEIPCKTERAKWSKYGLAAGPIRNRKMADDGDVLVAIPDEQSKGTRDMINAMKELGKPCFVITPA